MSATINSIPASNYVSVLPGVIGAGQGGVSLNELMLTSGTRVPIGTIQQFANLIAVQSYFGATSAEAIAAGVYFLGYEGATQIPQALYFAQYPTGNVGAYLRGGVASGLTLAQLQAITGVLTITIDGTPHTSSSINLSSAASFSGAAQLMTSGLGLIGPTIASAVSGTAPLMGATASSCTGSGTSLTVGGTLAGQIFNATGALLGSAGGGTAASAAITGTGVPANTYLITQVSGSPGGAGVYTTNNATTISTGALTVTSNVLNVTGAVTGTIATGLQLNGATAPTADTFVTALGTGTGGTGTYITTQTQSLADEAVTFVMPTVTYDTVSGAFVVVSGTTGASSTIGFGSGTIAAPLFLTSATGAVTSQGAIAAVPGTFMAAIVAQNANFATFQTLFDPDNGSGNAQKQLFAAWVNSIEDAYCYLCWDTDITPTQSTDATSSLGQILKGLNSSGTALVYETSGSNLHLAAAMGAYAAAIDFNATNGRATLAYKSQTGLGASATTQTAATNLVANGYNYYGAVATRGASWNFFYPGSISGPFAWLDTYLNQIWLNSQCQEALLALLTTVGSIPYTPAGYAMIRQALTAGADQVNVILPPTSPVAAALNNGILDVGVTLSSAQVLAVNALAGMKIDTVLQTQGWYLIIQPALPAIRAARTPPTIILLYADGGSIQQINLSSLVVQ